jgi:hypothetical protein
MTNFSKISWSAVVGALLAITVAASAAETPACNQAEALIPYENSETVVAYINGILTNVQEADNGTDAFAGLLGPDQHGKSLRYETLYNDTRGLLDLVEVFDQRLAERGQTMAGRFELLPELIRGGGPMTKEIIAAAPELESLINDVMSDYKSFVHGALTKLTRELTLTHGENPLIENFLPLAATAETSEVIARHRARLDQWIKNGHGVMLLAYSQGALFGNAVYQYAKSNNFHIPLEMVHIAPVSVHTLGREHTRVDKDSVLNLLALSGTIPQITNAIPYYWSRPPGLNDRADFLGHGLLEIYLNPHLVASKRILSHIDVDLRTMFSFYGPALP